MQELIVTPARRLGGIGQSNFCARCFKIQQLLEWKAPWNVFPSDYSRFDSAQKNHIEGHILVHGKAPGWLSELGDITGFIDPPNYHNFFYIDKIYNIKVRGTADLILKRRDGKLVIVDLKSAPPKCEKDEFAPTYNTQVNVYARAAEERGLGKVGSLAIVYLSAQYDKETMLKPENHRENGLAIHFESTVHMVQRNDEMLDALCKRFRELHDNITLPAGLPGCKDCQICEKLFESYKNIERGIAATHQQQREMYINAFPCG